MLTAAITAVLGAWGCMTIYAARILHPEGLELMLRQFSFLLITGGVICLIGNLNFEQILARRNHIFCITAIAMTLVLIFGLEINGMRGWFPLGNYFLQPSEFGKPALLLFLTPLATNPEQYSLKQKFTALSGVLCFLLLTALQPDYGMTLIFCGGCFLMMLLSGMKFRWLLLCILSLPAAAGLAVWRSPYVGQRFAGFWNTDELLYSGGWHIRQFELAVARGGWNGTGLGNSLWSNSYLPLAHNDSVFASMAETLGVMGIIPFLLLAVALIICLWHLALKAPGRERQLFALAATGLLAGQGLLHISINLALLPPTGLTLPLISYGGSSLLVSGILIGLIFSASNGEEHECN